MLTIFFFSCVCLLYELAVFHNVDWIWIKTTKSPCKIMFIAFFISLKTLMCSLLFGIWTNLDVLEKKRNTHIFIYSFNCLLYLFDAFASTLIQFRVQRFSRFQYLNIFSLSLSSSFSQVSARHDSRSAIQKNSEPFLSTQTRNFSNHSSYALNLHAKTFSELLTYSWGNASIFWYDHAKFPLMDS